LPSCHRRSYDTEYYGYNNADTADRHSDEDDNTNATDTDGD